MNRHQRRAQGRQQADLERRLSGRINALFEAEGNAFSALMEDVCGQVAAMRGQPTEENGRRVIDLGNSIRDAVAAIAKQMRLSVAPTFRSLFGQHAGRMLDRAEQDFLTKAMEQLNSSPIGHLFTLISVLEKELEKRDACDSDFDALFSELETM